MEFPDEPTFQKEALPLLSRVCAITKTVFSFFKAVCFLFSENAVKTMKEHAACVWTGVQYKKTQSLANFDPKWVVPLIQENEELLRNLLDESPYPLNNLILANAWPLEARFDQLKAPVMLSLLPGQQGERSDPVILIKISGKSPTGEIIRTVVVLAQLFSRSNQLFESTLVKKENETLKSLFFKSNERGTFYQVSKETDGFRSLKQLLSEGQVIIDQITWKLG